MTMRLDIIEHKGEAALLLPDDLLAHLGVEIGDDLFLTDTPHGFELRAWNPETDILPSDAP
jgi:hypothetical protein